MMKTKSKKGFRRITSMLLAGVMLALPLNCLNLQPLAATTESNDNLICFEDDFNRENGSIHDNNGWYSQYNLNVESEDGSTTTVVKEHKIVDNYLALRDFSIDRPNATSGAGQMSCYSRRSETAIDQRVSVEILNLGDFKQYASANVHLRFVHPSSYSAGPDSSYYAEVTNQYISIKRVNYTWSGTISALDEGGEPTYYVRNVDHRYRIEFSAEGTNPTKLTATLYDITAGDIPVVTVSGTDSKSEMQCEGTVALSSTSNGSFKSSAEQESEKCAMFDNFKYEYVEVVPDTTTLCSDNFDRDDSQTIGNDWVVGSQAAASISSNAVNLSTTTPSSSDRAQTSGAALMRPMSEAALNQVISADFQSVATGEGTTISGRYANQGGVLIARAQSSTATATNCYRLVFRLDYAGIDSGKAMLLLYGSNSSNNTVAIWSDTTTINGVSPNYMSSASKYRLELSVKSISSTQSQLDIKLYGLDLSGNISSTYISKTLIDSDPNLQQAGTAGVSIYDWNGGAKISIDNFNYDTSKSEIDENTYTDNFDRDDSETIGNDWVAGSMTNAVINSNVVNLATNHPEYTYAEQVAETALVRPMSEASLNQFISADFQSIKTDPNQEVAGKYADQGGAIIARSQDTTVTDTNCYRLVARLGVNGSGNTTTFILLYNSLGETIYAKTSGISISSATKYRLQLNVISISDTQTLLEIKVYGLNTDGTVGWTILNDSVIDDDPNLQKAGTAGFSMYDLYGGMLSVDNFTYTGVNYGDDFTFNESEPITFKTFEAEAVETYNNNYTKQTGTVTGASDLGAAIDSKASARVSYEDMKASLDSNSGYIAYTIYTETAGNYPVRLRYRAGCDSQADYDAYIAANGGVYAPVIVNGQAYKFESSAQYGEFGTTDEVSVALNQGTNIIYCMAPTAELSENMSGAYIDYDCLLISGDVSCAAGNAVIPGDANGDNNIDLKDLVKMKKHVAGIDGAIDDVAADLNSEGEEKINSMDLTVFRKYILSSGTDTNEFDSLSWLKFNATEYPDKADMLNNTYYKLNTEKELTVGYIGGSVTQGTGATDEATLGWRGLTESWLKEQYPEATINAIDGANGGNGSSYGLANVVELLNLDSEVESEKPDLVFIEYAVNDYYNGETATSAKNNMEYIIRKIYSYVPDADIIIVLTGELTNMNLDYETKAAHQWIAERFKLPYISVAEMLWNDMVEENNGSSPIGIKWAEYFGTDWVHPNDAGHAKYAQYIENYITEIFAAKTNVPQGTTNSYIPLKNLRF